MHGAIVHKFGTFRGMSELNENTLSYVRHVMEKTRLSATALAEEVGISPTTLTRPLNNKDFKFSISNTTLAKIEAKTGITVADFLSARGGQEVTRVNGGLISAAVVATVEAGAWREVDEFDQSDPEWMALPPDKDFPSATQEVYNVSGTSMNALKPFPILPGSRVVAIRYDEIATRYPLRDGLVVVVQRSKDDGQSRELSIKQIAWFDDRIEFQPRSTDPKHKPIVVPHDDWEDNGVVVEVLAIVRRSINEMPR